ncbi:phosphatidylglycerophosphatase and protein-tyrosine phosphatase 1 isoform X1 [Salvelinus sp. IW2-2015]|uniref:phosphatidylglycerophosphatase and protein-tyrosine phosphatase 1 isoform X1 n=1 Tax=Salvelinus sp. IW2-2015 TaxID=2691554 RepID=UPI000CDFB186|nr:phosphatidylglycerophosphatase and protein-tyrosine phosphatase 1 isoform X2 [Salvelinus alpinus]
MSGALARVLFYPTLAYNVVMEKVSSRRWFNRVDQTVILGALPFKSMTNEEWKAEGVEQLRLSTVDLTGVPSLENLHKGVEFALSHREKGSSVYVHCKAGRCRSATLAAAYIIRIHCWSPEEACQMLASVRPHVIIRSSQLEMLRRYHQQVCGGGSI